ncbi:MAG: patatin-like phospholipase family protein [Verrucomicrobiales bacterium]|nr:patatin-like phospholipase family protein [Verrucomicrobiales bacterium]
MIGLALSGGGSRAMAFHLGCLRALDDLELLERVGVLSTISGGSVIGAYYAYSPGVSFEEFEAKIRVFLRAGFHSQIALELLKPRNLVIGLGVGICAHAQDWIGYFTKREPRLTRFWSRTHAFENVLRKNVYPNLSLSSPRRNALEVVIGACELRTGTAFRFGNGKSGNWRHGEMVENDTPLSLAVAASAAYPILLPAFDKTLLFRKGGVQNSTRVLLTDGGVYDNLGVQVLEPGRDPRVSLHTFPCDYIISCNAGQGQEAGLGVPLGFGMRLKRGFEVVHRRVQDTAMHHLHSLKETGRLRGFAMPYLGQQDSSLPWRPSVLVPREKVIEYPTDFAAMSDEWIDALSSRGEQLTRILVSAYLPELLG